MNDEKNHGKPTELAHPESEPRSGTHGDSHDDEQENESETNPGNWPPHPNNVVVIFKLSDERMKAKKQAAKARRDFMRERARDKTVG
jgi:hypothetical protein